MTGGKLQASLAQSGHKEARNTLMMVCGPLKRMLRFWLGFLGFPSR